MSTSSPFSDLVRAARSRAGLRPFLEALGFDPALDVVPPEAWTAYGLGAAVDLEALAVVGRAGSLEALLLETAPGTGPDRVASLARRVRARNPARLHLFVAPSGGYRSLLVGTFGLDDGFRHLTLDRGELRASDLDALREMAPVNGERGLELAVRQARALDRSRITRAFFRDFSGRRRALAESWTGVPTDAHRERAQLALLVLSRLTFLYFLQRRGALAGDPRYLPHLFGRWAATVRGADPGAGGDGPGTFFRARLQPLFFGALNRRPEDRDPTARALGELPYLNGGLFERHALERRFPDLDLPDPEVRACLDDLLERYRFTSTEAGAGAGYGVDPEMLGRVFEGLMAPEDRGDTGSFYTPAAVVNRVVREAVATYVAGAMAGPEARAVVDGRGATVPVELRYRARRKLERVRVLDPACGSGAFLLGALQRLTTAVSGLTGAPPGDVSREIVARSLHGVDLLDDAALLCSLRLWLALADADPDRVRPLPNLDRRIRQGDALVDPLELDRLGADASLHWHPRLDPELRHTLRALEPAGRRYLRSGPDEREEARHRLQEIETRLARHWIHGLRAARARQLERLRVRAADRDLFGETPTFAVDAARDAHRVEQRIRELDRVARRLEEDGALPFFSFGVHFADASPGFDLVISNPPWVRSRRWPRHLHSVARRFEVCRDPGWPRATALTGAPRAGGAQVDLCLLFVERSLRLLAPGGVLAVLVSAKSFRALYGGAARRMLLRDLEIALIEDHALDPHAIFRADAFAGVIIGRRRPPGGPAETVAGSTDRGVEGRAHAVAETAAAPGARAAGPPTPRSPIRIRMTRRSAAPLEFTVHPRDLPLFPDDPASPWLMAPPRVRAVFRRMQAAGLPLGQREHLRVRRGIMTGANDVLIFSSVEPKLSGLSVVEAEGGERRRRSGEGQAAPSYRAVVESDGLRPLVRGSGIDAFRYDVESHVAWCHGADAGPRPPGPRLARYLARHRSRLEGRAGWRAGLPLGVVFRLSEQTLGSKVAWHDLSDTLRAVALPAALPMDGTERELIPLNTVYFIPTPSDDDAVLLAGVLNALPITTLARAVAERAKDARFRFFAWTVSTLPLPVRWAQHPAAEEVAWLSRRAHRQRGIGPEDRRRLDRAVGRLFGLGDPDLEILAGFDAWLRGEARDA